MISLSGLMAVRGLAVEFYCLALTEKDVCVDLVWLYS